MNQEIYWNHYLVCDVEKGSMDCVGGDEVVKALNRNWECPWIFTCIIGVDCHCRVCGYSSDDCVMSENSMCILNAI